MERYKSQLNEMSMSVFDKGFEELFKRYSAKEAAGILKISMISALPNEKYMQDFIKYLV
jgi:hypothetical protein